MSESNESIFIFGIYGTPVLTGMHVLYHKFELWCLLWILYMVDANRTWLFLSSVCVFHPVDISEIQQIT